MSLSPRTRLGSYEIAPPLGVGGIGEAHGAWDTKLDRGDFDPLRKNPRFAKLVG